MDKRPIDAIHEANNDWLEKGGKLNPPKVPYFICGEAGANGRDGLPDKIFICPTFGLSGFAVYTKEKDYSEPGY